MATQISFRTSMLIAFWILGWVPIGATVYLTATCKRDAVDGSCGRLNSAEEWLEANVPLAPWVHR